MFHENLIVLVGAPRSGTTMLQRLLGSHSRIFTHPEPHLLTPLAYLGYFDRVERAPYDHINAAEALRELVDELPNKETDYLDCLRAYPSAVYEKVLAPTGKDYFLDKTPAYGLVLPFITKLYPRAKYVVLTRHPMAVWHSQAHSFFGGDYRAALAQNPVVEPYVNGIGRFLVDGAVPYVHVRYEDLVADPEPHLKRMFEHIGVEHEPGAVDYGKHEHISKSYGDPMSVEKHTRPVTDSVDKWASDLLANPDTLELAREVVARIDPIYLEAWGYPKERFFDALEGKASAQTRTAAFNTYKLKRQVLLTLRKNIHQNAFGSAVKKVRYYCDVLLRT